MSLQQRNSFTELLARHQALAAASKDHQEALDSLDAMAILVPLAMMDKEVALEEMPEKEKFSCQSHLNANARPFPDHQDLLAQAVLMVALVNLDPMAWMVSLDLKDNLDLLDSLVRMATLELVDLLELLDSSDLLLLPLLVALENLDGLDHLVLLVREADLAMMAAQDKMEPKGTLVSLAMEATLVLPVPQVFPEILELLAAATIAHQLVWPQDIKPK